MDSIASRGILSWSVVDPIASGVYGDYGYISLLILQMWNHLSGSVVGSIVGDSEIWSILIVQLQLATVTGQWWAQLLVTARFGVY